MLTIGLSLCENLHKSAWQLSWPIKRE